MHPVRSTALVLPRMLAENHALDPATDSGVWDADDAADTGFFGDASAPSLALPRRTRSVGVIRCASGDFKYS